MEVPCQTQNSSPKDCQQCNSDDETMVAIGYCQNCNEYLCAICLKVHRKQAMSRNHITLDGDNMPKVSLPTVTPNACSEMEQMVMSCVPLGDIVDKTKQKVDHRASHHDCLISCKEVADQTGLDRKSISEMDAYFDCEINIKTQDDSSDCCIGHCVLICPSQIIVTDRNNTCVKLVEVSYKTVSKLNLKYCPTGVAVVNPNLIAVTFPYNRKIQFLTITAGNKIIESDTINVHAGCKKIAIHEDKIIGITSESVEIMSMSGQLIKSLSHPNMIRLMNIAVVPSSQMFYVSNSSLGYKAVLKFDFDGNLIATYQDKDLVDVRGLKVTRDGTVLVCNWARDGSIHMITPDCKKIKELLKNDIHFSYP